MNKILKSFSDKKFRYGAFSTVICVFVIALLVVVNLVFSLFDLKFDLTLDKRYSISQASKDVISGITDKITIYALVRTGSEDLQYTSLLNQYADTNSNISVVYKDPYLYPAFANSYKTDNEDIAVNSIIVESAKRFKVIPYEELFTLEFDYNTYQQYVKSIDIEPQVTNAIKYVSDDNTSVIYRVNNHGEAPLADSIIKQISMANYDVKDLNLFEAEAVPNDAAMLFLSTPNRDYSKEEAEKALVYLQGGGRAVYLADSSLLLTEPLPNYKSITDEYCIAFGDDIILEGNRSYSFNANPYYILPTRANHDITSKIAKNTYMLTAFAASIAPTENVRSSVKIEPLLVTSRESYAKNADSVYTEKEQGDAAGPFGVAVAVTNSVYMPEAVTTKLVVVGTSSIVDAAVNEVVSGGNTDFILNSINWLNDESDYVYIPPQVNAGLGNLVMSDMHGLILTVAAIFVLPCGILATGIIVWLKRRAR